MPSPACPPLPYPALRWSLPTGLECVFSTLADGDLGDPARRAAWAARTWGPGPTVACLRQVHGVRIVEASTAMPPPEADALVTADPGLALGVFGADCPGLILCSEATPWWGAAHCGWRGTAAGLAQALLVELVRRSGVPAAGWQGFVGPGISGPAYEVDAPVLEACAWPAEAVQPGRPGHAFLDVPLAVALHLRGAGAGPVARAGICTFGDPRLGSHRAGTRERQLLAAWRPAPPA